MGSGRMSWQDELARLHTRARWCANPAERAAAKSSGKMFAVVNLSRMETYQRVHPIVKTKLSRQKRLGARVGCDKPWGDSPSKIMADPHPRLAMLIAALHPVRSSARYSRLSGEQTSGSRHRGDCRMQTARAYE
jgi:hypothetical protein